MKLAIAVGHNLHPKHRGSVAVSGMQEYDGNLILAHGLQRLLPDTSRVFTHRQGNASILKHTVTAINEWDPDYVLELHWNAVTNKQGMPQPKSQYWKASYGIYWHTSPLGLAFAARMGMACCGALGTTYMPPAPRTKGYPMLRDINAPSILLETHNGLDRDSHEAFLAATGSGLLAQNLCLAIQQMETT